MSNRRTAYVVAIGFYVMVWIVIIASVVAK